MTQLFLALLACLGLLRIWELRRSKANWQHHKGRAEMPREPLFVWMVLLHSSFFVIQPLELMLRKPAVGGLLTWIALAFALAALLLRFWTLRTIGKSWNVRVVGGPHYPIVCTGPYRYIRHPNYLVVILELLFIPLIHGLYVSAAFLTLANALVLRIRIRNEETVLRSNPEWRRTMQHKPAFLPFPGG